MLSSVPIFKKCYRQWDDLSQANSVAGSHVQYMIFHQIWGMVGFRECLGGFPITFVFDENAKRVDIYESWAETVLLLHSNLYFSHISLKEKSMKVTVVFHNNKFQRFHKNTI